MTTKPSVRSIWVGRALAVVFFIASIVLTLVGFRFLFAGDWLESHTVRYGPLAILLAALLTAVTAIAFAVIGVVRRPREVLSWVVAAIVLAAVPLFIVLTRALGT
ncbi:hypothetical protein [Glaciihabitans sp. UYNi722]|uniref:hypothetical protein n=1 Tax=Glaciihabitans sp. UYNi722 TaxID=3156344 RepID=UPI003394871D